MQHRLARLPLSVLLLFGGNNSKKYMLRVDNEDEIKLIKNSYETYKNSGTFNKGSSLVQRTEGSSDRDNAIPERQREWNDGVNGLHEGRTSNISPNNQEVDRNIREREAEREQIMEFFKKNVVSLRKKMKP